MKNAPLTTDHNRRAGGRFTAGNTCSRGPRRSKMGRLRQAALAAVRPQDVAAIVKSLIRLAVGGDVAASKELLLRVLGRPVEHDLVERIDKLEAVLLGRHQ